MRSTSENGRNIVKKSENELQLYLVGNLSPFDRLCLSTENWKKLWWTHLSLVQVDCQKRAEVETAFLTVDCLVSDLLLFDMCLINTYFADLELKQSIDETIRQAGVDEGNFGDFATKMASILTLSRSDAELS